jgi:hypothetical protein
MGKSCVSAQKEDLDDLDQRQLKLESVDPYAELREKEAREREKQKAEGKASRERTPSELSILDMGLGEIDLSVDPEACAAWEKLFGKELKPEDVLGTVVTGVTNIDFKNNTLFHISKCSGGVMMTLNCKRSDEDCIEKKISEKAKWYRDNCQIVISRLITRPEEGDIQIVEERTDAHVPGACKQLYRCMLPIYQQMGAKAVTLDADEVGSYAWVRYGFRPKQDGEKSWSKLCGKIGATLKNLETSRLVTQEEAAEVREWLKSPDPETIVQIAGMKRMIKVDEREVSLGFMLLNKNIWEGVLDLQNDEIMQEVWAYIGK